MGVELLVGVCILGNTVSIGYQASWGVTNWEDGDIPGFDILDYFFTFIFTTELVLRIIAEGKAFYNEENPNVKWNLFDFVVVGSALLELLTSIIGAALPNVSALRMLRTLRLMRIFRVIRVMRFFRDLRVMMMGIVSSLKPLLWACLLLLIIMYMYGVLVLMMIGDEIQTRVDFPDAANENADMVLILFFFGDLVTAIWTLFKSILRGSNWGEAA